MISLPKYLQHPHPRALAEPSAGAGGSPRPSFPHLRQRFVGHQHSHNPPSPRRGSPLPGPGRLPSPTLPSVPRGVAQERHHPATPRPDLHGNTGLGLRSPGLPSRSRTDYGSSGGCRKISCRSLRGSEERTTPELLQHPTSRGNSRAETWRRGGGANSQGLQLPACFAKGAHAPCPPLSRSPLIGSAGRSSAGSAPLRPA